MLSTTPGDATSAVLPNVFTSTSCEDARSGNVLLGDSTLFAREDEVMASWRFITPILEHWQEVQPHDFPNYPAGTWGPKEAEQLIRREGRRWRYL